MSTQREQAIMAIRSIIAAPRSQAGLSALGRVLDDAQNDPPNGAADGSIMPQAYAACRRLHNAMMSVQKAFNEAADALREPAPAPF